MQSAWNYISTLGIKENDRETDQRSVMLSNQLNFIMLLTMLVLLVTTIGTLSITRDDLSYGTLRVAVLLGVSLINLIIARNGYPQISKMSLIFLSPVVFMIGPTLIGYVEEEGYTYYPYLVIGTSIIPQLLLDPGKEKLLYRFSLLYYFLLVVFIDRLMMLFDPNDFPIVERINTFYAFYKIAHIGLFVFLAASIYYLRNMNFRFEHELNRKINEVDRQNKELKQQKDEIERQKDELVSKEISTWQKLVNIISHEIVNSAIPITNLAGLSAQMLENESGEVLKPELVGEEVTADIHHSLKIIESRTKGLINFVNATKSLTMIPQPVLRSISVAELFERIAVLYQGRFKDAGLKLKIDIVPVDLKINADLELIEQVIINLIQNALDAMKDTLEPELSISAFSGREGHAEIIISDNGPGIKEELLEKIFLPYFSTKNTNSGIGLSISQQIMMLHHARLEVASSNEGGASFRMIF